MSPLMDRIADADSRIGLPPQALRETERPWSKGQGGTIDKGIRFVCSRSHVSRVRRGNVQCCIPSVRSVGVPAADGQSLTQILWPGAKHWTVRTYIGVEDTRVARNDSGSKATRDRAKRVAAISGIPERRITCSQLTPTGSGPAHRKSVSAPAVFSGAGMSIRM